VRKLCGRLAGYSREEASRKEGRLYFVVEVVYVICCIGSRLRKTGRVSRGKPFWACKSGEREGKKSGSRSRGLRGARGAVFDTSCPGNEPGHASLSLAKAVVTYMCHPPLDTDLDVRCRTGLPRARSSLPLPQLDVESAHAAATS
jgi:hypothetical protein